MPTLQYPNNPNTDTAFVVQDDGTKNRALMTAPQDTSTIELPSNPNSTKGYVTVDGKKQRVVLTADISGAGGDQHNLGYYATSSALTTAHPTAEAGDWAIVGATDTVWIWDTDNTAWVDSDQKGQVTSVNNQTGDVTITGADILPTQTGNAGKFLVTNGTSASWSNELASTVNNVPGKLVLKSQNGDYAELSKSNNTTTGTIFGISVMKQQGSQWGSFGFKEDEVFFEVGTAAFGCNGMFHSFYGYSNSCTLGYSAKKWANVYTKKLNNDYDITVPSVGGTLALQIATLPTAGSTYEGTIYQFTGTTDSTYTNGRFYKCVSDGQTPATYSWEEISFSSGLPSQTGNSGKFLTTDGTDASWSDKPLVNNTTANTSIAIFGSVQSYYSGSIAIGHSSSSVSTGIAIGTSTSANDSSVCVGYRASSQMCSISIGKSSQSANYSIAIGLKAQAAGQNSIQIGMNGTYGYTNSDANTMKVGNANGNFEIMSADGTIPTDRFTTTPSADGTYVPTLTISSGVATRSWSAPSGGGSTGTTASLVVANWSSNTQTVNVTGVTASNNVIVAPAPASQADYTAAGIICTAQGAGTLTFTCTTVPSSAITVNVLVLN